MLVRVAVGGHYNDSSNYTQYSVEGCSTTLVPVLGPFGKVSASDYEQLISNGFLLTWQLPSGKFISEIIKINSINGERSRISDIQKFRFFYCI